ncbi:MAG: class I SAM-dependent methyltransferase [Proteobacteria bacterium]|nr:class I SAM-dependent methyltransferase [Burkholderiales bacterium]
MKPIIASYRLTRSVARRVALATLAASAIAWLAPSAASAQSVPAVTAVKGAESSAVVDEDTDTPYVPTPAEVVERMLQLAGVGAKDYLIDIGSGDGRIVLTAVAKFGARGHGIEIDPRLIKRSQDAARKMGIADRAQFLTQDLFDSDFSKATVISVYLLPKVMQLLTPKLAALAPGTRIVSHDYAMLADWGPDLALRMYVPNKPVGRDKHSTLMLWTVPAPVAGRWNFQLPKAQGGGRVELAIAQAYQVLSGKATIDGQPVDVTGLRIDGERMRFTLEPPGKDARLRHEFDGLVSGERVSGSAVFDGQPPTAASRWEAQRLR